MYEKAVDIYFPNEGNRYSFILTTGKPISDIKHNMEKLLKQTDGIDDIQAAGRYSFLIRVARTYSPDSIITAIKTAVTGLHSVLKMD